MARKYMTKEVTFTTVKLAKMEVAENGLPVAVEVAPVTLMGHVSKDKAQKLVNKEHDEQLIVFAVEVETQTYKMKVSDFIKQAELVTDGDDSEEEDEDEDDNK